MNYWGVGAIKWVQSSGVFVLLGLLALGCYLALQLSVDTGEILVW